MRTPSTSAISWASRSILTSNARMTAYLSQWEKDVTCRLVFYTGGASAGFNKYKRAYCASCCSIIEAFMTSFLTTGPIRMFEYCQQNGRVMMRSSRAKFHAIRQKILRGFRMLSRILWELPASRGSKPGRKHLVPPVECGTAQIWARFSSRPCVDRFHPDGGPPAGWTQRWPSPNP